jgi:hypothetical protein
VNSVLRERVLASVYPLHPTPIDIVVENPISMPLSLYKTSQNAFSPNLSSSFRYPAARFEVVKKVAAPQQTYRCFAFNYRQLVHISTGQGT